MGTHGAHGWQHITGSHALKDDQPSGSFHHPFKKVVRKWLLLHCCPDGPPQRNQTKTFILSQFAQYFKSKVHVVTPDETDEFLRHQVRSNITFSEGFFKDRGIEMTSAVVPSSGFDKEVVKYAVSVDADLIAIMNLQRNNLFTALTFNHEQYIITNDDIIPPKTPKPHSL